MKRKRGLMESILQTADLRAEPVPGSPLVEIIGQHRVLVENHMGVIQYSPEEICVRVRYGHICMHGSKLELACMSKERLIITGCVEAVQLCKGGR